jgi:hypothetical protein
MFKAQLTKLIPVSYSASMYMYTCCCAPAIVHSYQESRPKGRFWQQLQHLESTAYCSHRLRVLM